MSSMKWSDLQALGWKIKRYNERTRRYTYVTPVRNSKTRTINRQKDLDPCDAKYANILFPKISGKAGGKMRHSTEQDGGGGQQVQEQDGLAGLDVEEGAAGLMEVEQGATGLVDGVEAAPANTGMDMTEIATVVPGIKDHKSDLVKAGAGLTKFMLRPAWL